MDGSLWASPALSVLLAEEDAVKALLGLSEKLELVTRLAISRPTAWALRPVVTAALLAFLVGRLLRRQTLQGDV